MAALTGVRGQYFRDRLYDASGTITNGGTPQLVLPMSHSRSSLIIENISDTNMIFEFGSARATATLTSGTVTSCAVTNSGFGFSVAPNVIFYGGAYSNINQITPTYSVAGLPEFPSPSSTAKARCVMTGSAPNMSVSSIVIDNPGSRYAYPPYVFLSNNRDDFYGCATPSATSGILLLASGGSYTANGTVCITDQVSVFCSSTGKAFTCKFTL